VVDGAEYAGEAGVVAVALYTWIPMLEILLDTPSLCTKPELTKSRTTGSNSTSKTGTLRGKHLHRLTWTWYGLFSVPWYSCVAVTNLVESREKLACCNRRLAGRLLPLECAGTDPISLEAWAVTSYTKTVAPQQIAILLSSLETANAVGKTLESSSWISNRRAYWSK